MNHVFQDKILTFKLDKSFKKNNSNNKVDNNLLRHKTLHINIELYII